MNDQQLINILRGLIVDGVNAANSGHPGGAMSSLDFAYQLFTEHLSFDPEDPKWLGRDRFILSAGHESMLLYSLLRANGWIETEDLKNFRQLHSKTPGHPENHLTPGVECTTGPLGQGAAMSVGFAIGASHLKAKLDNELFNNYTWALLGDGCMQEGVTLGAASLAGHLGLDHLIWYYDKNKKQISGNISRATSDDEMKIFEGLGWDTIKVDGHNPDEIRNAISKAKKLNGKPTLIVGETVMAKGAATLEGSYKTHGAPFSKEERAASKKAWGIPEGEDFYFPDAAEKQYRRNFDAKRQTVSAWKEAFNKKIETDANFKRLYSEHFEKESFKDLPKVKWDKSKPEATRNSFGSVIEAWADSMEQLIGGSADLEPSNMTGAFAAKVKDFNKENPKGRNLAFGVREFPMSAIANGLALYGGFIPFDATFLSFSDYSRSAIRLGAIQKARVIHEFTHDSFYVGEDGPTHQPVEHIMSLRMIPDHYVMRPADGQETEVMMRKALELQAPSSICLTRQKLPMFENSMSEIEHAERGAWVVKNVESPDIIIFATGSEVSLALKAADLVKGKKIKIVSIPCWKLFFSQPLSYQDKILDWNCENRVSIEAGVTMGWEKFVGHKGLTIGIDHFGDSAPAADLEKLYGFTPEKVAERIKTHFS